MVSGHADSPHPSQPALQILTTLASLTVGALFFALWFWLLPGWLGFQGDMNDIPRWRWLFAIPSVAGFAVALRCIWDFGWTGRGTPAPFVPPQRLVVVGFYRYVRNPMYVGFFTGWIGLWVIFGRANAAAILIALLVILAVNLFVRFYEEPTLRRLFASDYDTYCRNVPRWFPRLRPWQP
jgi:protein-S-isoprenylcysteine O-methyltransferase Ste14